MSLHQMLRRLEGYDRRIRALAAQLDAAQELAWARLTIRDVGRVCGLTRLLMRTIAERREFSAFCTRTLAHAASGSEQPTFH